MQSPDALNTDPVYCYRGQVEDVRRFAREVFLMTPLVECAVPEQIRKPERNAPVFIFVPNHPVPVPQEFFDYLQAMKAMLVRLERNL